MLILSEEKWASFSHLISRCICLAEKCGGKIDREVSSQSLQRHCSLPLLPARTAAFPTILSENERKLGENERKMSENERNDEPLASSGPARSTARAAHNPSRAAPTPPLAAVIPPQFSAKMSEKQLFSDQKPGATGRSAQSAGCLHAGATLPAASTKNAPVAAGQAARIA